MKGISFPSIFLVVEDNKYCCMVADNVCIVVIVLYVSSYILVTNCTGHVIVVQRFTIYYPLAILMGLRTPLLNVKDSRVTECKSTKPWYIPSTVAKTQRDLPI